MSRANRKSRAMKLAVVSNLSLNLNCVALFSCRRSPIVVMVDGGR